MKIKELRDKKKEELKKILSEKIEIIRKTRFDVATKQVKDIRKIRNGRRDVARILSLLNEK